MGLWRVEVAGVSHRYVEAESAEDAEVQVADSIMKALSLHATVANRALSDRFASAGPLTRKRLLASMDGLISPRSRQDVRRELRRLQRLIQFDQDAAAWATARTANAPMPGPDPRIIERLVKSSEVAHIERNLSRLTLQEGRSPLHDE